MIKLLVHYTTAIVQVERLAMAEVVVPFFILLRVCWVCERVVHAVAVTQTVILLVELLAYIRPSRRCDNFFTSVVNASREHMMTPIVIPRIVDIVKDNFYFNNRVVY